MQGASALRFGGEPRAGPSAKQKSGMVYRNRNEQSWGESRLDRQDSVAADGWSKRSNFEDSDYPRPPRVSRRTPPSPWRPLLLIGLGLAAAAAVYRWLDA